MALILIILSCFFLGIIATIAFIESGSSDSTDANFRFYLKSKYGLMDYDECFEKIKDRLKDEFVVCDICGSYLEKEKAICKKEIIEIERDRLFKRNSFGEISIIYGKNDEIKKTFYCVDHAPKELLNKSNEETKKTKEKA